MKRILMLTAGALLCTLCAAQELGRVISSTPVMQQVTVPRQVCGNELVPVPSQKSGAGALLGGIAGGAVGNAVGQGGGRAAATLLGVFGGAILGDRIEGQGAPQSQLVQRCTTQTVVENRVTYYQVVYEYAGKQYAAQLPYDPGPQIRLQIAPADAVVPPAPPVTTVQPLAPQVVYAQPDVVTVATPWVPGYYPYPYPYMYRAPIGVNLQFGYVGHGHGHWR